MYAAPRFSMRRFEAAAWVSGRNRGSQMTDVDDDDVADVTMKIVDERVEMRRSDSMKEEVMSGVWETVSDDVALKNDVFDGAETERRKAMRSTMMRKWKVVDAASRTTAFFGRVMTDANWNDRGFRSDISTMMTMTMTKTKLMMLKMNEYLI